MLLAMNVRRSSFFLLALMLAAGSAACSKHRADPGSDEAAEPGKEAFGKLSLDELDARMGDAKSGKIKLAIFDNNKRERFDKSHIPGAKWVQFDEIKSGDLPSDKETTLVFYCANEH
jgi:hypothetical protein